MLRIFDRHQSTDWLYDLGEVGIIPPSTTSSSAPRFRSSGHRVRLHPKRFIASDSELASRFQLHTVCLANASAIEAVTSNSSSNSSLSTLKPSSTPVIAGSKRRKQTLLPASRDYEEAEDEEDDEDYENGEEEEFEDEEDDEPFAYDKTAGIHRSSSRLNGRSATAAAIAARSVLTGLREVDYKRRFLQVAWHPQRQVLVAISGKEIFFTTASSSEDEAKLDDNDEEVENESDDSTNAILGSPLDVKAAKRRRKRQDKVDIPLFSSFTDISTVNSSLSVVSPNADTVASRPETDQSLPCINAQNKEEDRELEVKEENGRKNDENPIESVANDDTNKMEYE